MATKLARFKYRTAVHIRAGSRDHPGAKLAVLYYGQAETLDAARAEHAAVQQALALAAVVCDHALPRILNAMRATQPCYVEHVGFETPPAGE